MDTLTHTAVLIGILTPYIGTTIGSSMVFLIRNEMNDLVWKALYGVASGIMMAIASFSLLGPAIEMSSQLGGASFLIPTVSFLIGVLALMIFEKLIPEHDEEEVSAIGRTGSMKKSMLLAFSVALHNIPIGMASGVALAGAVSGHTTITLAGALVLALGIGIHNAPEGAIISLPLHGAGLSRGKSFLVGMASGIIEPIFAVVTIVLALSMTHMLPVLLAFAAGAMVFVVVKELIPEAMEGCGEKIAPIMVALGFALVMLLETVVG